MLRFFTLDNLIWFFVVSLFALGGVLGGSYLSSLIPWGPIVGLALIGISLTIGLVLGQLVYRVISKKLKF